VDFNVPMEEGRIIDDGRIKASLPTIHALLGENARVIIATHLGRPDGRVVEELRVAPLARRLGELLQRGLNVAPGVVGADVEAAAAGLAPGDVLMLENLRFEPGEERNDPQFSAALARLADVYVDDAFGAAHRAHASTVGVASQLPSAAGLLLQREVEVLSQVLSHPREPLVAIVGGAKISTKMGVISHLLPRVSKLLVGGAMASTLLRAGGVDVGSSKIEEDQLGEARALLERAGEKVELPIDVVVAGGFSPDAARRTVSVSDIPPGWMALDIGPRTVERFGAAIASAGTVVWNGPLGVYEMAAFRAGTEGVARLVAAAGAISIVGGGDLAAALHELGLEGAIDHVSTGGGATLEFLEGKTLPGIAVLERAA
jgi:phosphoglycerate kinase